MDRVLADFVKEEAPVFYWSILFAPADKRDALLSLYAFALEIKRIPKLVSEPALGEIRMQWWVDGLKGERVAELRSHPFGAALINTCTSYSLPREPLVDLIEARVQLNQTDPETLPDEAALELFCGRCHATLIHCAVLILNDGRMSPTSEAAGYAGMVIGLMELLREDVFSISHTDLTALAREHLIKTRLLMRDIPKRLHPAFLPLVSAEPFLNNIEQGVPLHRSDPSSLRVLRRMMWGAL